MSNTKMLSWNDRFALIDAYKPTDEQVCLAFGVEQSELETARGLRTAGTFIANTQLDTGKYSSVFSASVAAPAATSTGSATTSTKPVKATKSGATTHAKPESATKKVAVKIPAKRGRKGDKIAKALQSVTTTPVAVDSFIKQHGVSLAVLRQSKRFLEKMDASLAKKIGKINVRQDKGSKQLMIWREDA